jgi:hypothetical protein
VVVVATLLDTLPPPLAEGVDRLYYQMGEILTIATAQQVECAHWRRARDSTSSLVCSRADWQKTTIEPSAARVALPLVRFSS